MKFKIKFILLFFVLFIQNFEATKRHSRITGKKCIYCHKSKKGGNKNLNKLGKEFKIYLKDKKRARKKKKTKLKKDRFQYWKNIIKKHRQQRKKGTKK